MQKKIKIKIMKQQQQQQPEQREHKTRLRWKSMGEIALNSVFYTTILLVLCNSIICSANYPGNPLDYREEKINVSCVAHETKFTCDCHNEDQHMILPHLHGNVYQIEVTNCKVLSIDDNTLGDTRGLRKVTFKNIDQLILNKYALSFPLYESTGLIIEFEKVNFGSIDSHAISGNIEEVSFIGGRIDVIHPFAFTTTRDRSMLFKMDGVWIKKVEPQAFKKFAVEQLTIANCVFEANVPSKSFYDVEVQDALRITNNRFHEAHTRAFSFKTVSKLIITNNYFDSANAEWIEAQVLKNVLIKENNFGLTREIAFKAISINRNYLSSENLEIRFSNNTVRFDAQPRGLVFNEKFSLIVNDLKCDNTFDCKEIDTTLEPPQPKSQFFRLYSDSIFLKIKPEGKATNSEDANQMVSLKRFIDTNCSSPSPVWFIVIGSISLALLLIIIALVVWFYRKKQRERRKLDIVIPEPRTYKETQIVYQIETAELLKTDL